MNISNKRFFTFREKLNCLFSELWTKFLRIITKNLKAGFSNLFSVGPKDNFVVDKP